MVLKFLNKKISNTAFLAPMLAYSNQAFRVFCFQQGCGLAITEMVSVEGLKRNQKLLPLKAKEEKFTGIQLFGSSPESFVACLDQMQGFDFVDINFGCPEANIVKQGYGAALLRQSKKMFEIVSALKQNSSLPVTAKIRLGFEKNESKKIVEQLNKAGADAVFVHGRTKAQGFSGKADWNAIAELVKEFPALEIVGNGDIRSLQDFKEKTELSKTKFAMIGRIAVRKPWIFKEINENKEIEMNPMAVLKNYINLCKKLDCLELTDLKLKGIALVFGVKNASKLREKMSKAKSVEEFISLIH